MYTLPNNCKLGLAVVNPAGFDQYSVQWDLTLGGETIAPPSRPLRVWEWAAGVLSKAEAGDLTGNLWSMPSSLWIAVEYTLQVKAKTVAVGERDAMLAFIRQHTPQNIVVHTLFERKEGEGIVQTGDGGISIAEEGEAIAGNHGYAEAGDRGSAKVGDYGRARAGRGGTAAAGKFGSASVGDNVEGETRGYASVGDNGTAYAGHCGRAYAGDNGTAEAGDYGYAEAGYGGTAITGRGGVSYAGETGRAKAGEGGELHLSWYDQTYHRMRTRILFVGEGVIMPDTFYYLDASGKPKMYSTQKA